MVVGWTPPKPSLRARVGAWRATWHMPRIVDQQDMLRLLGVLVLSMLVLWVALIAGLAIRVFLFGMGGSW